MTWDRTDMDDSDDDGEGSDGDVEESGGEDTAAPGLLDLIFGKSDLKELREGGTGRKTVIYCRRRERLESRRGG